MVCLMWWSQRLPQKGTHTWAGLGQGWLQRSCSCQACAEAPQEHSGNLCWQSCPGVLPTSKGRAGWGQQWLSLGLTSKGRAGWWQQWLSLGLLWSHRAHSCLAFISAWWEAQPLDLQEMELPRPYLAHVCCCRRRHEEREQGSEQKLFLGRV